jgi:pilus assembly protein CpaB
MPTSRKPKKAFIQFAIAAVVSLVLGIGAIGITLMLVSSVATSAEEEKKRAFAEAQKAKTELEQLKRSNETNTNVSLQEIHAVVNIPSGTVIRDSMVSAAPVDEEGPALGSFGQVAEVVGRMTAASINQGEVIRKEQLLDSSGGLPVPEGMRAITIQIDPIGGLNGALSAGASVDVLTTLTVGEEKVTRTLLQGAQIIAAGGDTQPSNRSRSPVYSITLAVTPSQAELLALANSQGKFHLTLRNDRDREKVKVSGTNIRSLLTNSERPAVSKSLPPPPKFVRPSSEVPINFSIESLPFPSTPEPPGKKEFTMTIFKGGSTEDKTFEVQE